MTASADTTPDTTLETDRVMERIMRVVHRANAFVLGFAKCNSPVQQRQLSRSFLERLSNERTVEITLDEPIISLLGKLEAAVDVNNPPAVVNVYGLEKSIYAQEDYSPALGRLNNDRDLIRRTCPAVLLLWLPDYALDKVAISAPDFWAWRSGVYEFSTDKKLWKYDSALRLNTAWPELLSLTLKEKQQEVERLEELLRTARNLSQRKPERRTVAQLLLQVGTLYESLGSWQKAKKRFEESRAVAEEIKDKLLLSSAMHNLAQIEELRGNADKAQHLYEQSLSLSEQIGDKRGIAIELIDLAYIHADKGKLDTAQHLFERSVHTFDQITEQKTFNAFCEDVSNRANALSGLGYLCCVRGEWKQAQNLFQQVLTIAKTMGNKSLYGITLYHLGLAEQQQGNLVDAERLYEESIQVGVELGDKSAVADCMTQMGDLKTEQGNYKEAFDYLIRALTLSESLQSPVVETINEQLHTLREQIGAEQFHEWMKEVRNTPLVLY